MAQRVPLTGGEKETLLVSVDRHRDAVLWKLAGLDDEQLRRPMTPSGMSLLGLTKHLASVDCGWFCETFGRPVPDGPIAVAEFDPDDPDAEFRIEDTESTADVVAFFGAARDAANAVVADLDIESLGTSWMGEPVTLRWVLIHMIEEYARHAGHMDVMRELLDGFTGDHDRSAPT